MKMSSYCTPRTWEALKRHRPGRSRRAGFARVPPLPLRLLAAADRPQPVQAEADNLVCSAEVVVIKEMRGPRTGPTRHQLLHQAHTTPHGIYVYESNLS